MQLPAVGSVWLEWLERLHESQVTVSVRRQGHFSPAFFCRSEIAWRGCSGSGSGSGGLGWPCGRPTDLNRSAMRRQWSPICIDHRMCTKLASLV